MVVSAIHQHGSAIAILTSPPLWKLNPGILCSWSCPCRSGHNVPLSPQQDKRFCLFCNIFCLYEWDSVIPLKFRALRIALVPQSVWLFVIPWAAASQTPLPMGILQARILGWVAISFSRRSSQSSDWTHVFWIAGRFFIIWVTRETHQ